jgi:capsid protein
MEEREGYKQKQRWMINNFIKPVYELWLFSAYSAGAFVFDGRRTERVIDDYYKYDCQPKRWEWIDPAKDAKAQETMIAQNLRSRSQVIRDQGGDPESVFMELAKEKELLESLGLAIIAPQSHNSPTAEDESDDEKED